MTKKEYILDFLKEINYAYNHPAMYDDLKRLLDEMEEEILESANCKWIPVETALPKEGVSVLVYAERNAYGDNGKYRKKVIDIGWQVDGHWHIDGCNGVVGIAWMQLPLPYKQEAENGCI